MRNLLLFIRRYFVLFAFLVVQLICWILLVKSNETHEALFAANSNEVTGWTMRQYNQVQYYFNLKRTNAALVQENARLNSMVQFMKAAAFDSATTFFTDTTYRDTLGRNRQFTFLPAKVVNNNLNNENNYITLFRGSNQGVSTDMAVVGPAGVVGRVIAVGPNYCRVMSLLNHLSRVAAVLKKDNYQGSLEWDGEDPAYLTLRNVPKSAKVVKGDSVLTSDLSGSFPPGLMIGTVSSIQTQAQSNFYTLRIRSATNFYTLQYVYLVKNAYWNEQQQIETVTPITSPR